ncbi:MAG: hypothetical protein GX038_06900 [Erysipelothrix sp.]|nr:hypothetical protein [Erysipelothrix sp.]
MNSFQLMGRFHSGPEDFKAKNSSLNAKIRIKSKANIMTSLENDDYEIYEIVVWKGMRREFLDSVPLNSIIGIKGRLQVIDSRLVLVAEHVQQLENY